MFKPFRKAFGLAMLLALMASFTVLAKGGFAFIAITGPGLEEEIRSTEAGLTTDFFAFADFYRNRVEAPANPGEGYEITRYYIDGNREVPFDQLHYYPASGSVYYDGIVNGSSEYDGDWYSANPDIQSVFESALPAAPLAKAKTDPPAKQAQSAGFAASPTFAVPIAILIGLVALLFTVSRRCKPSLR